MHERLNYQVGATTGCLIMNCAVQNSKAGTVLRMLVSKLRLTLSSRSVTLRQRIQSTVCWGSLAYISRSRRK